MWVDMRHVEPKGVGYNSGYTTLEGFFAPSNSACAVPFINLLGHVFDNGHFAANAGLGFRYLKSRLWGFTGYYDYRKTTHTDYNQVSFAMESLGVTWDFRLNGYFPVGRAKSHPFHTRFGHFKEHHLILASKEEFALSSGNAEIGLHMASKSSFPLYFAAGPYYLTGSGGSTWGGSARLMLNFSRYVHLAGMAFYDQFFHWTCQGEVGITIPFGRVRPLKHRKSASCSKMQILAERSVQRVYRNEIVPVDTKKVYEVARDPQTRKRYVFWFVDNTNGSVGTVKSPFRTLCKAQKASSENQIIYVFPGDGTSHGMDKGITLQDNQKLFGSGVKHHLITTQGSISIPALTSGSPLLSNRSSSKPVVMLGNGNEIEGIKLLPVPGTASAICGTSISDCIIRENLFLNSTTDTNGIAFTGSGDLLISKNTFQLSASSSNGYGALLKTGRDSTLNVILSDNASTGGGLCKITTLNNEDFCCTITNNTVKAITGVCGIHILGLEPAVEDASCTIAITQNTLSSSGTDTGLAGVRMESTDNTNSSPWCIWMDSNQINNFSSAATGGADLKNTDTTLWNLLVTNNSFNELQSQAVFVQNASTGTICLQINDNTVSHYSGPHDAFRLENTLTGPFNVEPPFGNSTPIHFSPSQNAFTQVPAGDCSCH
jgi:hypothetical protein